MPTYHIAKMRVVKPSDKMAEKHPDRFCTIFGVFANDKGQPLSITSKVITFDEARDKATVIDINKGILTLTEGKRGRTAMASLTADDIAKELNSLRKE
jgi:hypothetical protein